MTAHELLAFLEKRGFILTLSGETIQVSPASKLPSWAREQIREQKEDLLILLREQEKEREKQEAVRQPHFDLSRLPEPNEYGSYFFGEVGKSPSILPITGVPAMKGMWMATTDTEVLWDGPLFRAFESPEDALLELRRLLRPTEY